MSKRLRNKVAIVTGASKRIGASIARHLAAENAKVIVTYMHDTKSAGSIVDDIRKMLEKLARFKQICATKTI